MNSFEKVIGIHGVPRSGTSWLGQMLNSSPKVAYRYQPLFSYRFKDQLNETSSAVEIRGFFEDIYHTDDEFVLQKPSVEAGIYPAFEKDRYLPYLVFKHVRYHHILHNLLLKVPELKIIGIVRHPCSVLNSWLKAPKEFKPEWNVQEEWRYAQSKNQHRPEEFFGFERWKEVASIFLKFSKEYPSQFMLVKYAELLSNTYTVASAIFDFCGIALTQQTSSFMQASSSVHHSDTYAVFRKNQNDEKWKAELDENISCTVLDEIERTELAQFLL